MTKYGLTCVVWSPPLFDPAAKYRETFRTPL
jgi:hypothetical protein